MKEYKRITSAAIRTVFTGLIQALAGLGIHFYPLLRQIFHRAVSASAVYTIDLFKLASVYHGYIMLAARNLIPGEQAKSHRHYPIPPLSKIHISAPYHIFPLTVKHFWVLSAVY